jgi:hypothetical protein
MRVERQFRQVDPDNRLVAAELERRGETALREPRQAEDIYVWKGGDTTSFAIPIPVGSLAEYSRAQALESRILALYDEGASDSVIAAAPSAEGFRSPLHDHVLASTVPGIRLRHRRLREQRQSHSREVAGYLTVPQLGCAPGHPQALDLRSHPQWHYRDQWRPGDRTVPFPGRSGHSGPVPAAQSRCAPPVTLLRGVSRCVSEVPFAVGIHHVGVAFLDEPIDFPRAASLASPGRDGIRSSPAGIPSRRWAR